VAPLVDIKFCALQEIDRLAIGSQPNKT